MEQQVHLSDHDRELLQEISSGIHKIVERIEETHEHFYETTSERLNRELGISIGAQ